MRTVININSFQRKLLFSQIIYIVIFCLKLILCFTNILQSSHLFIDIKISEQYIDKQLFN